MRSFLILKECDTCEDITRAWKVDSTDMVIWDWFTFETCRCARVGSNM